MKDDMNLKGNKVAIYALLAIAMAVGGSFDRFSKHSFLLNLGTVAMFAGFVFVICIGIDQSVYKSNKSFRTMDSDICPTPTSRDEHLK